MKNCINIFALSVLGAALVACSSNDDSVEQITTQPQPNTTYTLNVNVSKSNSGITRALTEDGTTMNATWATTENIYVKNGDVWCVNALHPQTAEASSTLKGFIKGTEFSATAGHNTLNLYFPRQWDGEPDYTGQNGTLSDIAEKFDYATAGPITITGVNEETKVVNLSYGSPLKFDNLQAIVKFILKNDGSEINPSSLSIKVGDVEIASLTNLAGNTNTLYAAIPGSNDSRNITLIATVGGTNYTFTKSSVTLKNGLYYIIEVDFKQQV